MGVLLMPSVRWRQKLRIVIVLQKRMGIWRKALGFLSATFLVTATDDTSVRRTTEFRRHSNVIWSSPWSVCHDCVMTSRAMSNPITTKSYGFFLCPVVWFNLDTFLSLSCSVFIRQFNHRLTGSCVYIAQWITCLEVYIITPVWIYGVCAAG